MDYLASKCLIRRHLRLSAPACRTPKSLDYPSSRFQFETVMVHDRSDLESFHYAFRFTSLPACLITFRDLVEPAVAARRQADGNRSRLDFVVRKEGTIRKRLNMQESILIEPGSTAKAEWTRETERAALRREFEERLNDSSALAYRVARGVLRSDADAEDVAQEALLRAFQKFSRLRDRTRFRAWLVRISFRLALDRIRSAKRRGAREADWLRERERLQPASPDVPPEFQQQLERAMEQLPEKLRLALLLSAMQGHSLEEVSALLAVPIGTVKSRIFFAKKQLAEKLRCFVNPTSNR